MITNPFHLVITLTLILSWALCTLVEGTLGKPTNAKINTYLRMQLHLSDNRTPICSTVLLVLVISIGHP